MRENGKRNEAIAIYTGAGQSNFVFQQFDDAIAKTIEINRVAFDDAVARGSESIGFFEIKATAMSLVVAALMYLGLRPRIREYS